MDHLGKGDSLGQAVGDPLVDDPEVLVLDRLPQVAVHQEDFFPSWARVRAILEMVVDFPSPGTLEVKQMYFRS